MHIRPLVASVLRDVRVVELYDGVGLLRHAAVTPSVRIATGILTVRDLLELRHQVLIKRRKDPVAEAGLLFFDLMPVKVNLLEVEIYLVQRVDRAAGCISPDCTVWHLADDCGAAEVVALFFLEGPVV